MIWHVAPASAKHPSGGSIRQPYRPRDIINKMVHPSSIDHLSALPFVATRFAFAVHALRSDIESVIGPRCRA
jgi:hypothetical protein